MSETADLLDAFRGTRMFVPALLAVLCGLRRGEIAALRWRNVDLEEGNSPSSRALSRPPRAFATKSPRAVGRGRWLCPPRWLANCAAIEPASLRVAPDRRGVVR